MKPGADVLGVVVALFAMAVTAEAAPPPPFELVILKGRWDGVQWRYKEPPRPDTRAERFFTAGIADIEAYRWSTQAFTLGAEATQRLLQALAEAPGPGGSVRKLDALKASLGHGNGLERALYLYRFFVAVDGEPLYWGIFLDPPSQMAIDYPVMRSAVREEKAVFHVLPIHLPFYASDPGAAGPETSAAREAREVPSGMMEHFKKAAEAPLAVAFRQRIRDERIRRMFDDAGRLRPD